MLQNELKQTNDFVNKKAQKVKCKIFLGSQKGLSLYDLLELKIIQHQGSKYYFHISIKYINYHEN